MNGGMDTVVNFLSYVFEFLATHPNERRYLVENPDRIPMAVEEFLRRFGLVQLVRLVRKDLHFQGVCLKAGDLILLPTGAFGLDDRLYEEPLRVDFGRKRLGYATFGNGPHRCPGENLARTEVSIALTEWLSRIPDFEIDPERAVVKDGGIVACIKHLPIRWTVADPISAAA
jgi:cytochrome P450